jgi:hypothetical protein
LSTPPRHRPCSGGIRESHRLTEIEFFRECHGEGAIEDISRTRRIDRFHPKSGDSPTHGVTRNICATRPERNDDGLDALIVKATRGARGSRLIGHSNSGQRLGLGFVWSQYRHIS